MDILNIQSLIKERKVVALSDIDPNESYVQIGVYQPDNRKIGSANNTYPSFAIPLSELGGGSAPVDLSTLTFDIDLNDLNQQILTTLPAGLYIVEKVYISQASTDLSILPVRDLALRNSGIAIPSPWNSTGGELFTSAEAGPCLPPGCLDILETLSLPQMYATLYAVQPVCFPPPCNAYIVNGGENLNVKIATVTGVPATAKIHIVIRKIG